MSRLDPDRVEIPTELWQNLPKPSATPLKMGKVELKRRGCGLVQCKLKKLHRFVPHSQSNPASPIAFSKLPKLTREFLAAFRSILSTRKKFRNFDPSGSGWHGLYSVLNATFSSHKVVWREMATGSGVIAAARSGQRRFLMENRKSSCQITSLQSSPARRLKEADFIAGFLNSDTTNLIVRSYALATGISTHILDRVAVPRFSPVNTLHREMSNLARNARTQGPADQERARMSAIAAQLLNFSSAEAAKVAGELARL